MGLEMGRKDVEYAGSQLEQQAVQAGQKSAVEIVQDVLQSVSDRIEQLEQVIKSQPAAPMTRNFKAKRINGELVGSIEG
jgi:hypothetical protein